MINLIPNKEKKKMIRSFYVRLVALFLAMLTVAFFVGTLSLLPAYFMSNTRYGVELNKLKTQQNEPAPAFDKETTIIIKDINNKIKIVEDAEKDKFPVSEKIVSAILQKKISSIKITQISYDTFQKGGTKISLSGTATSRETLLSFRQALEDDPQFKEVDLPISNFVKGSNIQFSLTLKPA